MIDNIFIQLIAKDVVVLPLVLFIAQLSERALPTQASNKSASASRKRRKLNHNSALDNQIESQSNTYTPLSRRIDAQTRQSTNTMRKSHS
eukprot:6466918-Amphidinium_carterae.1